MQATSNIEKAFRARQVLITVKKAEDLDTIMFGIMKDSHVSPEWVLACAETGATGYEHYHILISCAHSLFMWYPTHFDGLLKAHPHVKALGSKQSDEDHVIGYMLKQGRVRHLARGPHEDVYIRSRVDYIKYQKKVPLAICILGGQDLAEKLLSDAAALLKKKQQAYAIQQAKLASANRTANTFLQ